ncbi:lysylphosphatidylglycerol synthase transmembrane domain-containing protein [Oscillatoria amoena NRMC-F 0135]|nr:lysylphosphatidylglycerol synthase transmembrane domain-containing protein [Oscillatoria laete-virens]MDL5046021.1 lysylphosphatidylglycerol synthase transmembrane domain-containing protein [Oscillatoria amoena NRMC-F 0135]MDL5052728.1 lysylphosphatidylglycerol synthase transmembrane domain-containing protein [Oscillatoria laete-virens NRMC-F 0139]
MRQKIKSLAWTLVKIAIAIGIFAVIYHRNQDSLRELPATLATANYIWLLPALALSFYMIFITAVRWRLLLRVQGIFFTVRHVLCINWIGCFFNNFMPGGTGGDLIKLVYAIKGAPEKKGPVFMSIVVDRVIGLLGLFILLTVMLAINAREAFEEPATRKVVLAAVGIMVCAIGAVVVGLWRSLPAHVPLVGWVLRKLPLREKLLPLVDAYQIYARHPRVVAEALGISLTVHASLVLMTWFLSLAFVPGGVSLGLLFFVVPMITLLVSIPITPGGLGVREGLFIRFLTVHEGVAAAAALSIGFMSFVCNLIMSLPGGLVYIFYKQHHEPVPSQANCSDPA